MRGYKFAAAEFNIGEEPFISLDQYAFLYRRRELHSCLCVFAPIGKLHEPGKHRMSKKEVTAGVILIGNELLSGRTQDTNLRDIARFLTPLGVQVVEARIVADDAEIIQATVRTFSDRFDYVFTTGGIGPTHDDITADCIAAAFDLSISEREDALSELRKRYAEEELNPARRRMARIPEGAYLILNPVSQAPGFQTRNVFTLAGVPGIMRGMLEDIGHRIEGGQTVKSCTVLVTGAGEGDVATFLPDIEKAHPGVSIGSYPFFNGDGFGVNLVARSKDQVALDAAEEALNELVNRLAG